MTIASVLDTPGAAGPSFSLKLKQKGKGVIIIEEQGTVNGLTSNGVRCRGSKRQEGLGGGEWTQKQFTNYV